MSGKRSYEPDPKVKPRGPKRQPSTKDRTATRRATLTHRSCGICGEPSTNSHHVLAPGAPYFGDDVPGNLVPLCGTGTTGCHGDIENENVAARKQLGQHIRKHRPDVVAYVLGKLGDEAGREWFRRRLYARQL